MEKTEILIIGGGVAGLSAAAELSAQKKDVLLVERRRSFGEETSSRNSEVIHSGVYYPPGSLKARLCVEGRRMLYELCEKNNIPYRRSGKLIAASNDTEMGVLERLYERGRENSVEGLSLAGAGRARELEPEVRAKGALYSAETGIIDSHRLMEHFLSLAERRGAVVVFEAEAAGIEKEPGGYRTIVKNAGSEEEVFSEIVINSAGLSADAVAAMAGIDAEKAGYAIHFCKGSYFKVSAKKAGRINRPVYPATVENSAGLGIHATVDLSGALRLGPDEEYMPVKEQDYSVSAGAKENFCRAAAKYLPFIEEDDLTPDFSGIRPKLQPEGGAFRDFVIREESDKNLPGFINLIGIESPGLTSAPAIARMVRRLAEG